VEHIDSGQVSYQPQRVLRQIITVKLSN